MEQLFDKCIIWKLGVFHISNIVQKLSEFRWTSIGNLTYAHWNLHFLNFLLPQAFFDEVQFMPWQGALVEKDQYVCQTFEVISKRQLNVIVWIDRYIVGRANHILSYIHLDVLSGLLVSYPFGQTHVN